MKLKTKIIQQFFENLDCIITVGPGNAAVSPSKDLLGKSDLGKIWSDLGEIW